MADDFIEWEPNFLIHTNFGNFVTEITNSRIVAGNVYQIEFLGMRELVYAQFKRKLKSTLFKRYTLNGEFLIEDLRDPFRDLPE